MWWGNHLTNNRTKGQPIKQRVENTCFVTSPVHSWNVRKSGIFADIVTLKQCSAWYLTWDYNTDRQHEKELSLNTFDQGKNATNTHTILQGMQFLTIYFYILLYIWPHMLPISIHFIKEVVGVGVDEGGIIHETDLNIVTVNTHLSLKLLVWPKREQCPHPPHPVHLQEFPTPYLGTEACWGHTTFGKQRRKCLTGCLPCCWKGWKKLVAKIKGLKYTDHMIFTKGSTWANLVVLPLWQGGSKFCSRHFSIKKRKNGKTHHNPFCPQGLYQTKVQ